MVGFARTPIEVRFWNQISPEPNSGCWLWAGAENGYGYGVLGKGGWSRHNGAVMAHRFSYTLHKGEIPNGYVIDHLCRNPCCVNPDHLEAVTEKVNINRGISAERIRKKFASITHCKNGHEYTEANTYRYSSSGYQHRGCRACRKEADRRRKERTRQNVVR